LPELYYRSIIRRFFASYPAVARRFRTNGCETIIVTGHISGSNQQQNLILLPLFSINNNKYTKNLYKKFMKFKNSGFTLVEIMIVVAIIGVLAAIAIPNFLKHRKQVNAKSCVNNLRVIDHAAQQWALEEKKSDTDLVPSPLTDNSSEFPKYLRSAWSVCPTNDSPYAGGFPINSGPSCPNYGTGDEFTGHILPPER
jgi:prepilin-type N-terminal cleavage/methylation domain-containing protein